MVRAAAAKLPADRATSGKRGGKLLDSLVHVVLPWLALIVVALAAAALILRWVAVFLTRPEQEADWTLVLLFGLAAAGVRLLTDANWTSLHHFYRERISYAFIQQRYGDSSRPLPYEDPLQFSKSRPADGGPELVACAVANVSDVEYVAADRGCMPFVFDWQRIGLTDRSLPVRVDATDVRVRRRLPVPRGHGAGRTGDERRRVLAAGRPRAAAGRPVPARDGPGQRPARRLAAEPAVDRRRPRRPADDQAAEAGGAAPPGPRSSPRTAPGWTRS